VIKDHHTDGDADQCVVMTLASVAAGEAAAVGAMVVVAGEAAGEAVVAGVMVLEAGAATDAHHLVVISEVAILLLAITAGVDLEDVTLGTDTVTEVASQDMVDAMIDVVDASIDVIMVAEIDVILVAEETATIVAIDKAWD
jgi:hypothetical protein